MRRINSKKQDEKKRKRNQILIGVILVVVMFGSVFGLLTTRLDNSNLPSGTVEYNGYEFTGQNNVWYLTISSTDYVFQYNPYQIQESFNLTTENLKYLSVYSGLPLYINSQENPNAEGEIVRVFNGIPLRIQRACLNQNNITMEDCDENLPLKDCTNNFIIVRTVISNQSRIYQENNCVFIEGSAENLIKLTDDYLYRVMGIKSQA